MAFRLPDLIVQSVLNDGFNNARRDPSLIFDVFSDLTLPFAIQKFGQKEIDKIQKVIENKEVSFVSAFALVPANLPCISIQLSDDREREDRAYLGNKTSTLRQIPFTTPEQLASLTIAGPFNPTSYNSATGTVYVSDATDLVEVHVNLVFVDITGAQFPIVGGIVNDPGLRQFMIAPGSTPSLGAACQIQTTINYLQYQERGNIEETQLTLGVHTKDPLLTKYLYILCKYFLASRRLDMMSRGFQLGTYTGSDFNRDQGYPGDAVFTRFLTISGQVQHEWRSDLVQLVDNVQVNIQVAKDKATNEALGLAQQTIQVNDNSNQNDE